MTEKIIHATLIAKREGMYTTYVFQEDNGTLQMCTKLPNWGSEYSLKIGDSGFLKLEQCLAGELFYNRFTDKNEKIKFSNVYFKEFIKDISKTEEIIL